MKYVVNSADAEGRDLWPGIAFPPERFVGVGELVEAAELPKGAKEHLLARGVISPAPESKED